MNVVCSKETLTEAIGIVAKAVPPRHVLPILEHVHIKTLSDGKLKLAGYDLDIGIESVIDAEIKEDGEAVIEAKKFAEIVRKMPGGRIEITSADNNSVVVKGRDDDFNLTGMKASEYPEFPVFDPEFSFMLKRRDLSSMIKDTIFSVGTNENKIVLTGCLLETEGNKISMVAVDGFRLSMRTVTVEEEYSSNKIIIPAKTLRELSSIIKESDEEIRIYYNRKNVVFEFDGNRMMSRLIEGEYMNYRGIIPAESAVKLNIEVRELYEKVDCAATVLTGDVGKSPIKLTLTKDRLNVSCETARDRYNGVLSIKGGSDLEIGFNHRYILDALKACSDERVIVKFNENINPCVITPPEGDGFLFLILPIKLRAD